MKLIWAEPAYQDLYAIAQYIAQDNPHAAKRWIAMLIKRTGQLEAFPESGRIVPELNRDDIRELIIKNYRIVYQRTDTTVTIVTVFEGHRLLPTNKIPEKP